MSGSEQTGNVPPMKVAEARSMIRDGKLELTGDKVIAAFTLMDHCEHDMQITLSDMLCCLDYGGVISEVGARCLYVRTGRDGIGWQCSNNNGLPFVVDRADWESWLQSNGYAGAFAE